MKKIGYFTLSIIFAFGIYYYQNTNVINNEKEDEIVSYSSEDIPEYNGEDYIYLDNNEPHFDNKYLITDSFEEYSGLDSYQRAGVAFANIGKDIMPTEERQSIGMVKPSGWHTIKYDIVEGKYLYNRCHLIGYQLTGENANPKNLITCTRHMNSSVMTQFENKVRYYIDKTNNHVLYRVTPKYKDNNLLASGVQIEALSVEDNGEGIKFNVYIYNVQEGIVINYEDGKSELAK